MNDTFFLVAWQKFNSRLTINDVVLLLRGEGYNGHTIQKDGSVYNRTPNSSSATTSTTQKKFGQSSISASGSQSIVFPASSDLVVSNNKTDPFTIEGWINQGSGGTRRCIIDTGYNNSGSFNILFLVETTGDMDFYIYSPSGAYRTGFGVVPTNNTWFHFAVTRDNTGTVRTFINGVLKNTNSSAPTTFTTTGYGAFYMFTSSAGNWNGYLDSFRFTRKCLYTTSFTTPTTEFIDYYSFSKVAMLLAGNGTNGSTTITDSTAKSTISRFGNTQISTAKSVFGGSSILFDGTGDYLTIAHNTYNTFNGNEFTIEFWVNYTSISSYQTLFSKGYNLGGGLVIQTQNGTGRLNISINVGVVVISETGTANTDEWIHYALVKYNGTLTLYRNGVVSGTYDATNVKFDSTEQVIIGAGNPSAYNWFLNGYLDDYRIINGYAAYKAPFTPPTSEHPQS